MRQTLITVFFHLYLKAIKKQHSRWGPGSISLAHQEAGVFASEAMAFLLLPNLAHEHIPSKFHGGLEFVYLTALMFREPKYPNEGYP